LRRMQFGYAVTDPSVVHRWESIDAVVESQIGDRKRFSWQSNSKGR
jgi:hypothetical protein